LIALLFSSLASCLLLANFISWTTGDLDRLDKWRRYGEDMSVATTDYLEHLEPTDRPAVTLSEDAAKSYMRNLQRLIRKMVIRHEIRPWQFWRTLRRNPLQRPGRVIHRRNDDVGRAWLTAFGFRLLGGVAPFLLFWLAAFLCVPVLIWVVWELVNANHAAAGVSFAFLFACSPFFVESMAAPYVAIGFYFVAILVVVAISVSMLMGNNQSCLLFTLRMLAAGLILAVCAVCRNGTVLLLPGILLAMVLGVRRFQSGRQDSSTNTRARSWGRHRQRTALYLWGLVLVIGPYLLVRPAKQHEIWLGVWQGLGDYDRTKGHVWADHVALRVFLKAGFDRDVPRHVPIYERNVGAPEREAFFRDRVLASVLCDPLWYLRILGRRFFAVVTQTKLYQLGAQRDPALIQPLAPNEGKIVFYYGRVTTADWMGLAAIRRVVPLPALWCVGLIFLSSNALNYRDRRSRAALNLTACVSLSIMVMPVLITTASAFETQAFMLVYFLALGFVSEHLIRVFRKILKMLWRREPKGAQPSPERTL
jgi:hypothetical protein